MRAKRKNFLPSLILALVLWGLFGAMIVFVDPQLVRDLILPGSYLPFFLLFFPTSLLSLALIFGNTKRGILAAIGLNLFLLLRIYGLGSWLNLVLITGIVIAIDRARSL